MFQNLKHFHLVIVNTAKKNAQIDMHKCLTSDHVAILFTFFTPKKNNYVSHYDYHFYI